MSVNRVEDRREVAAGGGALARGVGTVLTLLLLAPAAALLVARTRDLIELETSGAAPGCTGADTLGPVMQAGLPVVFLLIALPVALMSLANRSRGWIWLLVVLLGTVLLEVALRAWLPACL